MTTKQPTSASSTQKDFPYGAEWVRVDFHLHTKADKEFAYTNDTKSYHSSYIEALEKAGIRLGIITNHNKFDFEEFKALRSTAKKKGIALLPGVELSVNDGANGIHTLVVFSDQWIEQGQDRINPFLTVAFEGKTPDEYQQENGRSSLSLLETLKKLEGYHQDFFIVFAHVEQSSGLWREMNGGRIEELGENKYFRRNTLGFQKVRTRDGAGSGKPCRTKVESWLKDCYPAELEGSDPKNIAEIGKGKSCYLKLGELSFEAVKFALCDHANRVANEAAKHTASHIRSIEFEGGILDQQTIYFSPELNTVIGIRGSGKSSVLEAVRYVLDIPRGEKSLDTKYKDDLIRHTLGSGGKVTLKAMDAYGQEFTVSRIIQEAPNVYQGGKLQPGVSIRETVLRRPIYFGQKDLSSTGEGFESDLVEKLAGEKLQVLRLEIETQRERLRDAVGRYSKLTTTADQIRDYEDQLADAKFRLQKFEEHGIADKLKKRVGYQQDATFLNRVSSRVETFREGLDAFIAEHEDELRNVIAYQSAQNATFFSDYFEEYAGIIAQIDRLKKVSSETISTGRRLDVKRSEFDAGLKELQDEFAVIERTLAEELKQTGASAIQPDDFLKQQQRKTKAEQMLEALTKQESKKDEIRDAVLAEFDCLNELWRREFVTIQDELKKVNENHTALRIEAEFKGDKEAAIHFMQQIFRGSNIRESTLRAVMNDYADFGGLFRDLNQAKTKAGSSPDLFEEILLEHLADFITWQVPNKFVIKYRDKELKHHSLGQRASALILYVLSQQENDVIIIDQPEDDLDNQTIYEDVIKLIRQMKPCTQFLFATHNPNFPVLGDAEQVHACHYQDENVTVQSGSIDAHPMQELIINIMEGGEEAFRKRKEVYNLWKPQN